MEPRIQYAKTGDGVSIAYAVFGEGPAIVFAGSLWGDIHMYKANVSVAPFNQTDALVSLGWSVIRYDCRGMGSSDRGTDDWTLEGRLRDLDAVATRAAPERFVVWGAITGGPAAIAYTAAHADRVSHLILSNTYAAGSEWYALLPAMRLSQRTLSEVDLDWDFFLLTLANAVTGYGDSALAGKMAAAWKTAMTPQDHFAWRSEAEKIDVRHLLSEITVPTLVVRDKAPNIARFGGLTERLARAIPNARLVETEDAARVANDFLCESDANRPDVRLPSGMTAILFADIADSTALTERLGDAPFREKARELDGALRLAIRERGGNAIDGKLLGDGVLAVFTSAREAIEAGVRCSDEGRHAGLPLHVGIHAGDVIREDDNVYGGAVNVASRIAGLSAAGEVLVSETVRSLARTSADVRFEDRGEQSLKGVGEPVRVWAVVASPNLQTSKPANQGA